MKRPKIKVGAVILRWNGVDYDKGIVFSATKKYVVILWKGVKEKIEKDLLKYQVKISASKEVWNWKAPTLDIEETFDEKVEGNWIKTYNQAGELVSMKLTEEAHKQMGRKPKQQKKS